MEPITYYYESINRSAIVVTPRQPLVDWINAIYPDLMPETTDQGIVYLVKLKNTPEEIEKWLKTNYHRIFDNELNERHQDEDDWPQKRNYKLFKEWFETKVYADIQDMEDSPIN